MTYCTVSAKTSYWRAIWIESTGCTLGSALRNVKSMTGTTSPLSRDVMLLPQSPPPIPTNVTLGTDSPAAFLAASRDFTSMMTMVLCE